MTTFDSFISNESEILYEFRTLTRELISRLQKNKMMTKTITITLRDKSFKSISRSKTIQYTDDFYDIFGTISNLVDSYYEEGTTIRLIGVGFSNLKDKKEVLEEEYNLFTYESFIEKEEKVKNILKDLQDKYGISAISLGIKNNKD